MFERIYRPLPEHPRDPTVELSLAAIIIAGSLCLLALSSLGSLIDFSGQGTDQHEVTAQTEATGAVLVD